MQEYIINVSEIEDLQTLRDTDALDLIFTKAERTIVGGGAVVLQRKSPNAKPERFEEFTNAADLADYKKGFYKYL